MDADSKTGGVFIISTLDEATQVDQSTAHTYLGHPTIAFARHCRFNCRVELVVINPFFHQRYCVSTIGSISTSEEVMMQEAIQKLRTYWRNYSLSTVGGLFVVCSSTKIVLERTQAEWPSPSKLEL